MNEKERLKILKEEKRKLSEEEKKIKDKLYSNKEERNKARFAIAKSRKAILLSKQQLGHQLSGMVKTLRRSSAEELQELSHEIKTSSEELISNLNIFSRNIEILKDEE
jgi:uncharacterized protein (DUF3084 family)